MSYYCSFLYCNICRFRRPFAVVNEETLIDIEPIVCLHSKELLLLVLRILMVKNFQCDEQ